MTSSETRLFGLRLRSLREIAGITQTTLAEKCLPGKGQDFVSKVEQGKLLLSENQIEAVLNALSKPASRLGKERIITANADPLKLTFWDPDPGKKAPDILVRAKVAYNSALQMEQIVGNDQIFRAAQEESYLLFEPDYVPEFNDGLDFLKSEVRKILATLLSGTQIPVPTGGFQPEYDAIRWTSLVENSRIVYPFPFILTPRRIHNWFVVPYAEHRRIGIALHQDNPNYSRWDELPEKEKTSTAQGSRASAWITRLLEEVIVHKFRIYGMDGWIQQELTPLLFRQYTPGIARYLPEYAVPLLSRDLVPGSGRVTLPIPKQLSSSEMALRDIYIFDLADRAAIDRAIEQKEEFSHLKILEFWHGFDLPVGVGFSISMVPTILPKSPVQSGAKGDEKVVHPWRALLEHLRQNVFSDKFSEKGVSYEAKFKEIGIDLKFPKEIENDT